MSFGNRETLHGWELMAPCSVSYLQSAYALITADHLPIGVFNGRDVALSESALHKSQDQRTFAHSSSSKHNYPIIIALLRHASLCATCSARVENLCRNRKLQMLFSFCLSLHQLFSRSVLGSLHQKGAPVLIKGAAASLCARCWLLPVLCSRGSTPLPPAPSTWVADNALVGWIAASLFLLLRTD